MMQPGADPVVAISDACFAYGSLRIINGLNLEIVAGQTTALLGPSGCGKTTLLRLIAGIETAASGTINISTAPGQIPISYMLQSYDAFPWLTVRQNLALSGVSDGKEIVDVAEQLGLASLLDRYPRQLSGGQCKRVALARCVLAHPALLILDEPFGSLDVKTKFLIFDHLDTLFQDGARATILVTHSVEEAIFLSDRILIFSGPPLRLVDDIQVAITHPRSAEFLTSEPYKKIEARVFEQLLGRERQG